MKLKIADKQISNESPCYIVAEMSGNHGGNINDALEILHQAKAAGVDAVKLQTYRASTITLNANTEDFQLPTTSPWAKHKNLYELYEEAHTPWQWHEQLFAEAKKLDLTLFSSPFDATAVELLESLGTPAYKIASPEITDLALLECVAKTKKPVILSTGVAQLHDIELAVATLIKHGCSQYILLKCTSAYPTPYEEVNLNTIVDMKQRFSCPVGISDHTQGDTVPIAAVALGAKFIEKHIKLDDDNESVDSFFSLTATEFANLVKNVRNTESALGQVTYELTKTARQSLRGRRSLYYSKDIKQGETITLENIKSVRPSLGLHPKYLPNMLGKKAKRELSFATRASLDDVTDE